MPEKISILKDSGETVSSNVVSVFMIPDTQKKYLISTENTVDPHGLTILHVSEIVDGTLQKIATDDEWSSIKTIMRAIISGNVGSYQYLQTIDSIKASSQYSRDISVSASAAKQMSDNYAARDVNSIPAAVEPSVTNEETAVAASDEVVPGISVVEEAAPIETVTPVSQEQPVEPQVVAPVQNVVTEQNPVQTESVAIAQPVQEAVPVEPVATVSEVVPVQEVVETVPTPVEQVASVVEQPVASTVVAPVAEPALEAVSESVNIPVVVEPHLVASSPVTLPVEDPAVQIAPGPVTFVSQADLYPANQPVSIPSAQIAQEAVTNASLGIKFDVNPSFSPNASLEEVVLASQEMFIEGVKNLVQTIQEKVYREMYNKEVELKAKEEMLNQREKMLNEQMMAVMSNFASMQGKSLDSTTKVDVDSSQK